MMFVLSVLFVDVGLLIDRPTLYVDAKVYGSYADCANRANELRAAYSRTYREAICTEVRK